MSAFLREIRDDVLARLWTVPTKAFTGAGIMALVTVWWPR